jgi:hypothetical protein
MGEYVEARKEDSQPFKPAQIVSVHKNGLYDISFLDKGEAFDIPAEKIRKVNDSRNDDRLKLKIDIAPPRDHKNTMKFNVGDQIEAFGSKDGLWRLAVISAVYLDSLKVDVVYSDHTRDWKIPISRIRNMVSSGPPTVSPLTSEVSITSFYVGMPVEARFRKGSFHFPAIVLRVDQNLKVVDLLFEEGKSESNVPFEMVRLRSGGGLVPWPGGKNPALSKKQENSAGIETNKVQSSNNQVSNSSKERKIAKYPLESKIQANFLLKGRYYPGRVTHFNPVDGLYSIAYDDGETEENVKEEYIRSIGKPVIMNVENKSNSKKEEITAVVSRSTKKHQSIVFYQIDDRIEGNYRGKGMYYSGTIQKVYPPDDEKNRFYDIEYDDGELEVKVKSQRIRRLEDIKNRLKEPPISKFTEGMVVEANYKNSGRYFSGIIQKQYYKPEEGTHCYDILYDDGDSEIAVPESNIRFHESITNVKFLKDDSVEGNYQNLGLFYPGRIRKVHTRFNDLYDIEYDDGEIEKRVRNVYIRPFDRPVTDNEGKKQEEQQQQPKLFLEPKYPIGLMIETNINKPDEWISGKIVNSFVMDEEVFYAVKYSSDGKEEENIPEENIRFPKLLPTVDRRVDNKIHDNPVDAKDLKNDQHQTSLIQQNEKKAMAAPIHEEEHHQNIKAVLSTPTEVSSSTRRNSSRKESHELTAQPITELTETGNQDKLQTKKQRQGNDERGEAAVGIRVECNYNNQGVWYSGVVIAEHEEDDSIDVQYDGNDHNKHINIEVETHIPLERVRIVPNKKTGETTTTRTGTPLKNAPENEKTKKKKPTIVPVEEQEETENEATTSEGTTPQHRTDHLLSSPPAEKTSSSFSPRSLTIEKNSLVAFQDFRRSNRKNHHWKKGRVIEIDYEQELVNIRVLAGNAGVESEIVENVSFEEIRVLKVKETSKPTTGTGTGTGIATTVRSDRHSNTTRSLHVKEELPETAVPAPLSLTNEDIRQLKDLLLQKNEEITRLKQSLQQTLQPIGHHLPSHNNDHNNYVNHFPEESSPVTGSGRANHNSSYFFPATHPHAPPPSLSWSSSPAVGHFTPHPPPHSSSSGHVPAASSSAPAAAGRQQQHHHQHHHNYHRNVHSSPNSQQMQQQNSSFTSPRRPLSSENNERANGNFSPEFSPTSPFLRETETHHHNFHSLVPSNKPSFPFSSLPLDYFNNNNNNMNIDNNHGSYQSQQMLLSMQNEIDHLQHSNQEYRERCHFLQEKCSLMTNEFFAMKSREENLLLQFNHLKASYDELTTKVNDRLSF